MLAVTMLIAAGSHPALSLWLGSEFAEKSWVIATILSVGIFFNGLAQIPHATIQAAGNVRATALVHLGEVIVYIPLLITSLHYLGIIGAAITWSARVAVDLVGIAFYSRQIHTVNS